MKIIGDKIMQNNKKERVVVAMSGGVDSSVVAGMMKKEGYEVIGVTLQLFDYGESNKNQKTCCATSDIFDARQVCKTLNIKHYVLNYESLFKEEVIEEFADMYLSGYTPIPCVKCNQTVKFRDLYQIAKKLNAKFLATGHYVQKIQGRYGNELHKGLDKTKDQSYFLFKTTREQLDFIEFPLGGKTKSETRAIAEQMGLSISDKKDSQDICFVPNGDYSKVIDKIRPNSQKIGDIIDMETGNIVGKHNGIQGFTIGQRKGIGIALGYPSFVVKICVDTNTVFLGAKERLKRTEFLIKDFEHILLDEEIKNENILQKTLTARIRSNAREIQARISNATDDEFKKIRNYNKIKKESVRKIILLEPYYGITPGQACVLYKEERLIGGGWIEAVL